MLGQINLDQLKRFAPQSPILAFSPPDTGSPMQDWCKHLEKNDFRRRELEECVILGDIVVRIADELEPEPVDHVRILSLEYAVRTLGDECDAREFVRCVRAIASPDAGQFEYEQIAAYYYGEIRRRGVQEVLKEMGLLGVQMQAVTSSIADRDISVTESRPVEQKLTVADQRRVREIAKTRSALPPETSYFDDELKAVLQRIGRQKISRIIADDFAEYLLDDGDKTIEELDRDFLTFENIEQYDENGIVGFAMTTGQRPVVIYDLELEIDTFHLPPEARSIAADLPRLFVGHSLGGTTAQQARRFVVQTKADQFQARSASGSHAPVRAAENFSRFPFSDVEFNEWLVAKLDQLYDRRVVRSVRRVCSLGAGLSFEYIREQEVNPDYEEMQYVSTICQILWQRQYSDFHLRSLRREAYHELYVALRNTADTADVAELKKRAYSEFKEQHSLSLKEFTTLNTVAKSQEVRLRDRLTPLTRKWLRIVGDASLGRLRFLKFALYNDPEIKALTRQEKQRLWDAVRMRETELKADTEMLSVKLQQKLFATQVNQRNRVHVVPTN